MKIKKEKFKDPWLQRTSKKYLGYALSYPRLSQGAALGRKDETFRQIYYD